LNARITPSLWFDDKAETGMHFLRFLFEHSQGGQRHPSRQIVNQNGGTVNKFISDHLRAASVPEVRGAVE
jgi:predicted 3-demethylubiquinone-9 3-methyltransferase (glyoxalase superfamily)